jgi:PIN domain nuclease of toxin-antitoxin system
VGGGDQSVPGKAQGAPDFGPILRDAGAQALPITLEHVAAIEHVPWHHRDPFDRMLVAQATVEKAVIVSADAALRPYGVELIW